MLFFRILEIAIILVLLVLIVTQILLPIIQGRALFPLFRDEGKLWMEDADIEQQIAEEKLRQEVEAKKVALDKLRQQGKEKSDGCTS